MNRVQLDRFAAICGMIWFIFIIDACFTWFFSWQTRYFMGAPFVFVATIFLNGNNGLRVTKQRLYLFFSILILALYIFAVKRQFVTAVIRYSPMMCIVFWRGSALHQMYIYLKRFIIFYAILSLFVEFLVLSKLWKVIPHMVLPPVDEVQRKLGYVNYFYGLFSIQSVDYSLPFFRTCGPGREGGHWAIYLGFLYFSEKAIYNRRNKWLMVCGILTLSPNILFAFLITESYCGIKSRRIEKSIAIILSVIVLAIASFTLAPKQIKDEIVRVIFERTLDKSIESVGAEGLDAIIDGRTGDRGLVYYDYFLKSGTYTVLTGGKFPKDSTMSDYRRLIMQFGFVGTFIILWVIIHFSLFRKRDLFGMCLLLFGLLVLVHRSWMFINCYWWTVMLLINNEMRYNKVAEYFNKSGLTRYIGNDK